MGWRVSSPSLAPLTPWGRRGSGEKEEVENAGFVDGDIECLSRDEIPIFQGIRGEGKKFYSTLV